ncbi:MAG: GDSL-type esterase/lipase family protein, partial [Planctomycetaceae bacterium]|nr:GDSL-type esterase/lipase family protein [Planctomycetaceae bacterium]
GYGVLLGGNVTVTGDLDLHGYAVNQRLLIGAYPLNSGARGVMVQGTVSGQHCDLDGVYAAPYSAGHVVVLMGDSITQGMSYGNAGVGAFILNDLVVRQAGGDYAILNKGISGDTADNMAAVRLATDALAVPGVSHVIIMAGTNDLNNSVSAADVETDLQAMYTAAHEAGAIVVAVTIPPREGSPGWDATKQAQLDLVNTWIMDPVEGAANVDYRIPLYATMEDPDDADALRAGWSLDKLHMTLAGYTKAEETEFAGVTWPTGSTEVLEQWNLSAITGGSGDCGTNSRITFTAPMDCYCVYSSQYWITADNWKTTSGGATPARMPLPQDTVYLDGASFDTPGRTFTANGPRLGKNINLTGITNGPTLDFGNTANTIYGSLTMPAPGACTFTSTASTAFVFAGKGAYAFTPNGASTAVPTGYTWNRPVWVSAPGGTLTISGQLTLGATNSLSVVYGTVNYQCQTVEVAENTKFVVAGGTLNLLNDTIWRAVRAGVLVHSDAGVLNMKNCILRHIDDVWTYDTPQNGIATFLTNDYFESSDEGGTGSITDDPLLVTEFTDLHLQAGSPCRNVGTDLGVGTSYLDPDGVNPDNFGSWEIGAYQFTAEGGVTRGFGGGLGRGIGR